MEPLNYYPILRSFIMLKVCLEKKQKFVQDLIGGGRELKILDAQSWKVFVSSGITRFIVSLELTLVWEFRGTQREILRKRSKNNNKTWIKLSEAILSILGDCWEKFIRLSSLPARLMEEFPASKVHLQPATWLTRKSPADVYPDITGQFACGHRVENQPFGGYWQIVHTIYTRHQKNQIPSDTLNCLFPSSAFTFLPRTNYFFQIFA